MILIEAGGSSTQVCQILHEVPSAITIYDGISPTYMDKDEIKLVFKKIFADQQVDNKVYYYGTGCRPASSKEIIRESIQDIFPVDSIEVASDLLAAARATARQSDGQINILGTGSASCLYKNQKIKEVYFNSGYLFGDYGSGFHLGQTFLRAYFENSLSGDIENSIKEFSRVDKKALIQKIYSSAMPKQVIANFAKCIYSLKQAPAVGLIIQEAFAEFIRLQIALNVDFASTPQYFVGSIAHFFRAELEEAMEEKNLKIAEICRTPIENLIAFHLT